MFKRISHILLVAATGLFALCARADYQPSVERVTDTVYAMVGPLGQRSIENDGLNANFGFIVTPAGVILIDSGASRLGAQKIEKAVQAATRQPIRWVINTGSQDHRWMGNDYFASQGAEIISMARTAATQAQYADQHMQGLERFLGVRMANTKPKPATRLLQGNEATLELGGETLVVRYTDAHFPGDSWVWMPRHRVMFSGDLVYVDRLLGVLPWSGVKNGQQAFHALEALGPAVIIPGHGRVCDLSQAKRETGDYYDFLVNKVGAAAKEMESMTEVLDRHAELPAFRQLENYDSLHRANMNRAFTEFESQ